MTKYQVEVVAQAIRTAFAVRADRPKPMAWSDLPEMLRENYRAEARAAIKAYESVAQ